MSRRCRELHLKSEVVAVSNLSNEAAMDIQVVVPDEREDRLSEYDSINELAMLPFQSSIAFFDNNSNLEAETIATNHSSKSVNSSSSESSYLEVIDDDSYLNPYQSIDTQHSSDVFHNYSSISAIDNLELRFSMLRDVSPFQKFAVSLNEVRIEQNNENSLAHSDVKELEKVTFNELRDNDCLPIQGSYSESSEINIVCSGMSTPENGMDLEKPSYAAKPDNDVPNNVCICPCNVTMNSLL